MVFFSGSVSPLALSWHRGGCTLCSPDVPLGHLPFGGHEHEENAHRGRRRRETARGTEAVEKSRGGGASETHAASATWGNQRQPARDVSKNAFKHVAKWFQAFAPLMRTLKLDVESVSRLVSSTFVARSL